jgi:hypothetical protein
MFTSEASMAHAALLSSVARPSDFSDILRFGSREELYRTRRNIETALRDCGETRSPVSELLRERLTSIRRTLAAV